MKTLIVLGSYFLLGAAIVTTLMLFVGIYIAMGVGLSVMSIGTGVFCFFNKNKFENKLLSLAFTGVGGLLLGASIGAIIGSAAPGVGTLPGALVGSLIGLVVPVVGLIIADGLVASVKAVSSSISAFSYTSKHYSCNAQPSSKKNYQSPTNLFTSEKDSHYPKSSSNSFRPR